MSEGRSPPTRRGSPLATPSWRWAIPAEAVPHLQSSVRHNEARLRGEPGLGTEEREHLIWLVMRQRNDLVVALERAGDKEGALQMHETLLEERRSNLPQPHEDVASTLLNIGMLKRDLGLLHDVGQPYEEALAIREAVLERMGPDDPERKQLRRDLAESHSNLGAFAMDLGRPREAARSYRRAREIYEGIRETEHERYANTTMGHGAVLGLGVRATCWSWPCGSTDGSCRKHTRKRSRT